MGTVWVRVVPGPPWCPTILMGPLDPRQANGHRVDASTVGGLHVCVVYWDGIELGVGEVAMVPWLPVL